jgi:VanZ family protein
MVRALRVLSWLCVPLLAVLSLLPAKDMVRTGLDGRIEHFIAYAGTMLLMSFAYGTDKGARNIAALCVYAGALEILQYLSSGRHPSFFDFAAGAAGAIAGNMLARAALTVLARRVGRARRPPARAASLDGEGSESRCT